MFLLFLFESSAIKTEEQEIKNLVTKLWLSDTGKETKERKTRAKGRFQGHTESYCQVILFKARQIQNSRTKSEKARNEFLAEGKIHSA